MLIYTSRNPIAMGCISIASSIDLDELPEDSSNVVEAVQVLLQGLGEDIHRVGLVKTPVRVARAFAFATKGYQQTAKDLVGEALFPEAGVEIGSGFAGGLGGLVVVRNINQFSLCASCLLPFKVCCHIAYISSGYQVVGLSKLARVADMFARRLQNPQDLADQICQGLFDSIKPKGVAVALQSWHLPVPGCHYDPSSPESVFLHPTITFSGKGQFEDKTSGAWAYFVAMLQLEGICIGKTSVTECNGLAKKGWCPCVKLDTDSMDESCILLGLPHSNGNSTCSNGNGISHGEQGAHHTSSVPTRPVEMFSAMAGAVEVILEVLVGGSLKDDLRPTAKRFTRWLLHFKKGHQLFEPAVRDRRTNGLVFSRLPPSADLSASPREVVYNSSVLAELDAPFCSLCEHHLLPFFGKAHIGYFASEATPEGMDRSVVLQIVEVLGHKLQVQERLTREIAEALVHRFKLTSIIVVLEACHVCMVSRGVEKLGSSTATDAVLGHFATDYAAKADFLEMILHNRRVGRTFD